MVPSKPKVGQITHFVMTFINTQTHKNQEHIDYAFALMIQMAKHYTAQDFPVILVEEVSNSHLTNLKLQVILSLL
jgi:hypothetical protein